MGREETVISQLAELYESYGYLRNTTSMHETGISFREDRYLPLTMLTAG